jgi:hypothetical protein
LTPAGVARRPRLDRELLARRGILLVVVAAVATGVLAGIARLGIAFAWGPRYLFQHGPLMVLGVFATIIGLERAVALARGWGFAAPAAGAMAAVAMLAGLPGAIWAASASCAALVAVNVALVRRQSAAFTWLMLAGSAVLFAGSFASALGKPVFDVVPTWIAFFVLTIAGERLELSRLAPTPHWAKSALVALAIALGAAACARLAWSGPTTRVLGASMTLIGAWQLRFDLARKTIRHRGLPRFSALGIILGSAWLVAAGLAFTVEDLPPAGPLYDGMLHAVFVGYVLSMVFAHAPIILPAVARVKFPYHRSLSVVLVLLHATLVVRIVGDLLSNARVRQLGGVANVAVLVLFALACVFSRSREPRRPA